MAEIGDNPSVVLARNQAKAQANAAKAMQQEQARREALNEYQSGWQNQNIFEFNPYKEGTQQFKEFQAQQAQALKQGGAEGLRNSVSDLYNKYYAGDVEAARIAALQGGQAQAGPQTNPQVQGGAQSGGQVSTQVQAGGPQQQGLRQIKADLKYDAAGRPIRNQYTSYTDAQGNVLDNLSLSKQLGPQVQVDQGGMQAFRERALGTGPSAWANMATEKQKLEEQQAIQNADRAAGSQASRAYNQLASRGGLSAGQRERLAMQSSRDALRNQQNIRGQGLGQRLDIGMQDQKTRDQFLSQLPGQDLNMANFQQGQRAFDAQGKQFDIGNALRDVSGLNAYNAGSFSEAMKEWGAAKSADAQARASSGGGKK